MSKFVKVSELSSEDRTKLRSYWKELWGSEFAKALVTDYEPDGEKVAVAAKKNSVKK